MNTDDDRPGEYPHSDVLKALDDTAHDLRNATGVVVTGGRLLADPNAALDTSDVTAIATDMVVSAQKLNWWIDRLIEGARAEQSPLVAEATTVATLVHLAERRARRVRPTIRMTVDDTSDPAAAVLVPLPLAERVIADALLLARADEQPVMVTWSVSQGSVELAVTTIDPDARRRELTASERAAVTLLTSIAARASIVLDSAPPQYEAGVTVRMPRSDQSGRDAVRSGSTQPGRT